MTLTQGTARRRILVTAGPTREQIDPVRFITNFSTGTFGYAIAKEARRRGHRVTLVSGPTALQSPRGVKFIRIESALDMRRSVAREFRACDCLIMAAAVSDWRARSQAKSKIKKSSGAMTLDLVKNPDILKELGKGKGLKALVGFSLETEELERNARRKMKEKNLDIIVATRLSKRADVFGDRAIDAVIIDSSFRKTNVYHRTKADMAGLILDRVQELLRPAHP